jgi:hypothetical protein
MVETARRLITQKGQPIIITKKVTGAYDPATSTVSSAATTETGQGVPLQYSLREIDGTMIKRGDIRLLLTAVGISKPQSGWVMSMAGYTGTVQSVDEVGPDGEPIIYKVQLRS